MDARDRLWFAQYRGDKIAVLDTKTGQFRDWAVGPRWSSPYDVTIDKNEEAWTGSMITDQVTRLDTKTGKFVDYLLPRKTNIRRVFVDNSTTPVTFWVRHLDTANSLLAGGAQDERTARPGVRVARKPACAPHGGGKLELLRFPRREVDLPQRPVPGIDAEEQSVREGEAGEAHDLVPVGVAGKLVPSRFETLRIEPPQHRAHVARHDRGPGRIEREVRRAVGRFADEHPDAPDPAPRRDLVDVNAVAMQHPETVSRRVDLDAKRLESSFRAMLQGAPAAVRLRFRSAVARGEEGYEKHRREPASQGNAKIARVHLCVSDLPA